jgi:outer membrane protein TolC
MVDLVSGCLRGSLLQVAVLCFAGVTGAQSDAQTPAPVPGQAIPGTLGVAPFSGSVPVDKATPGVLELSLQDAINRGLRQNLGALLSSADIQSARGQKWVYLSALLPHITADPFIDVSRINLSEIGFSNPGAIGLPTAVGPFSYFDSRVAVSQTLFDWRVINGVRASRQNLKAAEYSYKDARDLAVLAVGYTYLQGIADEARIETAKAQVSTAQALYDQAANRVKAGTSPQIDALRASVELQNRRQQLIQAKNNFSIQKLTIARVIGLPSGQEFNLADKSPYHPFSGVGLDEALGQAYASRSDYQAALADTRAAEYTRKAAAAGYLPSLAFGADYGAAGSHPSTATSVYDIKGTLHIPIFLGGSVHGDVLQADARLQQARERQENLRAQIDADVRTALFNLQSSAEQVNVARSNIDLAEQTLAQSRDRFSAGVTDTVEVVQSQELVASAHEQYINSLYNYNLAKITLARAIGIAEEGVKSYFKGN